jgi:sugar/nucleoside kinase (ribokinase family)
MSETIDAVVAGHICLDITPELLSGGRSVGEVFRPGSLMNVGPATVSTGGPVSNTALPLLRLGQNCRLMGKCGDDAFGRIVLDLIRSEAPGAQAGMSVVPGERTSYSVVLAPPGLDRMFLHCTGANDTFSAEDIDLEVIGAARLFHFGYPPLLARTYADGGAELEEIFTRVRAAGATTSLDLVYTDPASPAGAADWDAILRRTLPQVDLFTPSIEELLFMVRRARFDEMLAAGGEAPEHVDGALLSELGAEAIDRGAACALIKCGSAGIYLRTAGAQRIAAMGRAAPADPACWADRELFVPAFRSEPVVSGTGAGDCAIAGFLAALLNGLGAEDALQCAASVGAQNVTAADAVSGVQGWDFTLRQIADASAERLEVTIALPGFAFDEAARLYRRR